MSPASWTKYPANQKAESVLASDAQDLLCSENSQMPECHLFLREERTCRTLLTNMPPQVSCWVAAVAVLGHGKSRQQAYSFTVLHYWSYNIGFCFFIFNFFYDILITCALTPSHRCPVPIFTPLRVLDPSSWPRVQLSCSPFCLEQASLYCKPIQVCHLSLLSIILTCLILKLRVFSRSDCWLWCRSCSGCMERNQEMPVSRLEQKVFAEPAWLCCDNTAALTCKPWGCPSLPQPKRHLLGCDVTFPSPTFHKASESDGKLIKSGKFFSFTSRQLGPYPLLRRQEPCRWERGLFVAVDFSLKWPETRWMYLKLSSSAL